MKIISHRGNVYGPMSVDHGENHPDSIDIAIAEGFDVEIDLWAVYYHRGPCLYLGHDKGEHDIDIDFLKERQDKLWIHCKNVEAFLLLHAYNKNHKTKFNFFMHDSDQLALTSLGYIWAFPHFSRDEVVYDSIVVLPEKYPNIYPIPPWSNPTLNKASGVCTDYPRFFKTYANN